MYSDDLTAKLGDNADGDLLKLMSSCLQVSSISFLFESIWEQISFLTLNICCTIPGSSLGL